MLGGGARKIDQLLADDIVKRRFEPVARLDRFSRFALLSLNFMMFVCTHKVALVSIVLPYNSFVADRPRSMVSLPLRC